MLANAFVPANASLSAQALVVFFNNHSLPFEMPYR